MKTELTSKTKKTVLDTEGPFVVIGEKINPTGRKKLAAALQEGNLDYVRDLANKQIADALQISVRTVENNLRNIYRKLGVVSRTQLTSLFLHH